MSNEQLAISNDSQPRKMKYTGIIWCPSIPADWKMCRIKDCFFISKVKAGTKNPVVLKLARSGIQVKDVSFNEGQMAESYDDYNPVKVGDFLLNPMDLYSGANCNVSEVEGVISPAYVNLRAKSAVNPYFIDYYFKVQYWSMAMFAHGKGVSYDNRWTINAESVKSYEIPFPTLDVQNSIVRAIKKKCTQIDALIANEEQQIAKLKAYKQSVITETVTKGLDPDVPMKDSGVEWIGEIPEHWEVVKTGRLFKENNRKPVGNEVPLSLSQVDGLIATDEMKESSLKTSTYDNWKRVEHGDLVLNRFKAHLGVLFASKLIGIVSFHYGVYQSIKALNTKYYEYLYHSEHYKSILGSASNGMVVGLQNLSNLNFYMTFSLFPNLEEQNAIVSYLDQKCEQVDRLIAIKQQKIEKIQQYKKSIIYEYVTGKREVST